IADRLQIRQTDIAITLEKTVDRSSATMGDILTYTITYRASGTGSATAFRIIDQIPLGTTYVAGTLRLTGAPLSDSPGDDPGDFDPLGNRVNVILPVVTGGESGIVSFQVRTGP